MSAVPGQTRSLALAAWALLILHAGPAWAGYTATLAGNTAVFIGTSGGETIEFRVRTAISGYGTAGSQQAIRGSRAT